MISKNKKERNGMEKSKIKDRKNIKKIKNNQDNPFSILYILFILLFFIFILFSASVSFVSFVFIVYFLLVQSICGYIIITITVSAEKVRVINPYWAYFLGGSAIPKTNRIQGGSHD